MEVVDITVEVNLDNTSFPSMFINYGNSFLGSVKHLMFKFLADDLDTDLESNIGYSLFLSCLGVKSL
jgi:hypothetical protein